MKYKKKNKYKAHKKGLFKSKLEFLIWKQLPHKNKKLKIKYEPERIPYIVKHHYIPDFVITKESGEKIYIECKGYFRGSDRTKMIAAKAMNPELDIRIVFGSDSPLYKGSKSRNSDWAKKNGFPYAIKHIPREWWN